MTVSNTSRFQTYTGNGATTTFAVSFQFFEIDVYVNGALISNTNYSITQASPGLTGSVVFNSAPAAAAAIVIRGNTALTQSSDYVDNSAFPADTLERNLDRLTMGAQEVSLLAARSIRAPDSAAAINPLDFANNKATFIYVNETTGVPELRPLVGVTSPFDAIAGTYADAAASSAAQASTSAANAAIGASTAVSSASSAATSATNAATSATNAATSATSAGSSFTSFDSKYLGPKSSDPSVNNQGGALAAGMLYWNTSVNAMKAYSGSAWGLAYNPSASAVSDVFGRTGSIGSTTGDYTALQITNDSSVSGTGVKGALNTLLASINSLTSSTSASVSTLTSSIATIAAYFSAFGITFVGYANAAAARTGLGLGTSAVIDTGTSGTKVPLLDGVNGYSGQQNFTVATLTDQATITWDMNTQQSAKVTLGGSRTVAAPSNLKDGGTYILRIIQDATGSRTLTWNSVFKWPGGVAPTLSTGANAVDVISFTSNGTNLYGVAALNFS